LLPTATLATCRPLAEAFRQNGTWWVPTLVIMGSLEGWYHTPVQPAADTIITHFRKMFEPFEATKSDTVLHRYPLDSASVAALRAQQAQRMRRAGSPPGLLRLVRALGMPLLAGTDANPGSLFFGPNRLGYMLHVELAVYVAEGLTPLEALQTATLNPARYLRATDSLGTIAAGKLADLVLLDGDPLADLTNTRYFDRAALDAQLLAAYRTQRDDMNALNDLLTRFGPHPRSC
jgi:hypothetical protein